MVKTSMMNKTSIIRLNYVRDFFCDGKMCGAKCCSKWCVDIDTPTWHRWHAHNNDSLKEYILGNIKYNNERGVHYIELCSNGYCPFVRDDMLCEIQKTWGEKYLADICSSYPRTYTNLKSYILQSMSFTCPLVAKLVLFRKSSLKLEEVFEQIPRPRNIKKFIEIIRYLNHCWMYNVLQYRLCKNVDCQLINACLC